MTRVSSHLRKKKINETEKGLVLPLVSQGKTKGWLYNGVVPLRFIWVVEMGEAGERVQRPLNYCTSITSAFENNDVCPQKLRRADALMKSLWHLFLQTTDNLSAPSGINQRPWEPKTSQQEPKSKLQRLLRQASNDSEYNPLLSVLSLFFPPTKALPANVHIQCPTVCVHWFLMRT